MHSLSITYVFNDDTDRKLLFGKENEPVKDEIEAAYVITPDDPAFEDIIQAVPNFRDAEPGSEEVISGTVEELLDLYGLDIEDVETSESERINADVDLDGDGCHPLTDPTHDESEDYFSNPTEALVTESVSYFTDPSAGIPARPVRTGYGWL